MRVAEITTGLWTWTGLHPEWTPEEGGPDGWEQEVRCVYYEAPEAVVLVDPLVPPEDAARFYEALDRDVARAGAPVHLLTTTESHRRSCVELAERYAAAVDVVPPGVDVAASAWGERIFWLTEHRTLVFGDVVLGRNGGLELPRAWLEDDYDEVAAALRPLLDLPVERVLVTHGEPVLAGAHEALARALGQPA